MTKSPRSYSRKNHAPFLISCLLPAITLVTLVVLLRSANAWSSQRTSSRVLSSDARKSIPSFDAAIDRRVALQKVVTASTMVGIVALNGSEAKAAVAPQQPPPQPETTDTSAKTSPMNKRVYYPQANSLIGKNIVITGSSSGLGLESSKRLAAAGATVIMTARSDQKASNALAEVRQYLDEHSIKNANIYATTLDLADMQSIKTFPKRYEELLGSKSKMIDVLINNAGVAAIPEKEMTRDGFEVTFQTNHLGPFMLTSLLFPYLNREGSRIINVSSRAHVFSTIASTNEAGLDIGNLNSEVDYSGLGWPAYGRSKLENILFTQELQRRADSAGLNWLSVTALHPGVVATDIRRNGFFGVDTRAKGNFSVQSFVSNLFYSNIIPVEEGANTQVMLASFGERDGIMVKGQYFDENMKLKELAGFARDEGKARYLWDKSEELAGINFVVE